mmetsp:Transcript_2595/g.7085  ORF Transcript_2595/g.7085 Transcript_2595/m.7085 type:complete len:240 (+) Transcript_2595:2123-2842(+)
MKMPTFARSVADSGCDCSRTEVSPGTNGAGALSVSAFVAVSVPVSDLVFVVVAVSASVAAFALFSVVAVPVASPCLVVADHHCEETETWSLLLVCPHSVCFSTTMAVSVCGCCSCVSFACLGGACSEIAVWRKPGSSMGSSAPFLWMIAVFGSACWIVQQRCYRAHRQRAMTNWSVGDVGVYALHHRHRGACVGVWTSLCHQDAAVWTYWNCDGIQVGRDEIVSDESAIWNARVFWSLW